MTGPGTGPRRDGSETPVNNTIPQVIPRETTIILGGSLYQSSLCLWIKSRNKTGVTSRHHIAQVSLQTSVWITAWVGLKYLLNAHKETFIFCYHHFLYKCSKVVIFFHFFSIYIYRHAYKHFLRSVRIICFSKQGTVIDPLDI